MASMTTMVIIKDSYANYENKVDAPAHHDINGGYSVATATRWRNDAMNSAIQFLKMQLFRAALTGDLQKTVAQRNPNTMTLDEMYQITTDTQREFGSTKKTIAAIQPDEEDHSDDDEEIAAFQKWKFSKNADRKRTSNPTKGSYRGPYSNSRPRPGSNNNRNGKYCFYCKLQNHTQEDCFERIREKKPCKDQQGRAYRPKAYVTSNNDHQERDPQGQQQGFC
jgi:hypothetical protein